MFQAVKQKKTDKKQKKTDKKQQKKLKMQTYFTFCE